MNGVAPASDAVGASGWRVTRGGAGGTGGTGTSVSQERAYAAVFPELWLGGCGP